jgi:hypothetical protein
MIDMLEYIILQDLTPFVRSRSVPRPDPVRSDPVPFSLQQLRVEFEKSTLFLTWLEEFGCCQNKPQVKGDDAGSVFRAGTGHAGQDSDADKYDNSDHHINGAHFSDNKGTRNAPNDKSKTDEINYQGHGITSC